MAHRKQHRYPRRTVRVQTALYDRKPLAIIARADLDEIILLRGRTVVRTIVNDNRCRRPAKIPQNIPADLGKFLRSLSPRRATE